MRKQQTQGARLCTVHEEPVRTVPDDEHARIAAETFRMLSDPTRVKILWALREGETSVTLLAGRVGASTTTVSQHLSKLRLAGLVQSRREGTYVHYSATDSHLQSLLGQALSHAEHVSGVATGDAPHRYR